MKLSKNTAARQEYYSQWADTDSAILFENHILAASSRGPGAPPSPAIANVLAGGPPSTNYWRELVHLLSRYSETELDRALDQVRTAAL